MEQHLIEKVAATETQPPTITVSDCNCDQSEEEAFNEALRRRERVQLNLVRYVGGPVCGLYNCGSLFLSQYDTVCSIALCGCAEKGNFNLRVKNEYGFTGSA